MTRPAFRYYDLFMASFVVVLLCSNMIGPGKVVALTLAGIPLLFNAGNLFFPISYIFGDVLTEVYGFAAARRVIWAGFGALTFAALMSNVVVGLPPSPDEPFNAVLQPALEVVFGSPWRIVAGSMLAFWIGDFANSFVLAKMKLAAQGRNMAARFVASTVVGQAVDSVVFYPIAFAGLWSTDVLLRAMAFNWVFKVALEVALTPVSTRFVGWVKRTEGVDVFDDGTDFNPFRLDG